MMSRNREKSSQLERKTERIPLDVKIVTSHCSGPYGTDADRTHSPLHAGRGSFASMENIQEKNERRAEQRKTQFPQETKREFFCEHKHKADS